MFRRLTGVYRYRVCLDLGGYVSASCNLIVYQRPCSRTARLLQSSTVAYEYGVAGPFWVGNFFLFSKCRSDSKKYAAGATVQILMFSILACKVKQNAPRCHTWLEIIYVRLLIPADCSSPNSFHARFAMASSHTRCSSSLLCSPIFWSEVSFY